MLGYYGAIQKGLELVDQALDFVEKKRPEWRDLPLAIKVRLHLLQGDISGAEQAAGPALLRPISIPYARYKILIGLANVELAMARGDHEQALQLVEQLLFEAAPLTIRPEVPETIRIKGDILMKLGHFDQALQTLSRGSYPGGENYIHAMSCGPSCPVWRLLIPNLAGKKKQKLSRRDAAERSLPKSLQVLWVIRDEQVVPEPASSQGRNGLMSFQCSG